MVPVLAVLPYSLERVAALADGRSTLANHKREGIVVRPLAERNDPKIGRVVLKYISGAYLLSKKEEDFADV
jgi:hypothetical protein